MKRFFALVIVLAALVGCKNGGGVLLPNVSGKAGEIIVVMEKPDWEGTLGNETRNLLACDCPYLAQKEPLYNLVNVVPSGFADLFKVHRNIVVFNVGSQVDTTQLLFKHDIWAAPQCVVQVDAVDEEAAIQLLSDKGNTIVTIFEQAERDRVIRNSIQYEEKDIATLVKEVFPGSPHFPMGYKLRKRTDNFAWIADEKQYTTQAVLIYRYPADEENPFSMENLIAHRNEILKDNVPGMFENTYMTTGEYFPPTVEYFRYKGRDVAQLRGMWEVENDYMGGPFVSHAFYSPDGSEIIVCDAFVYAPRFDKRQYLRQVESIIYSWDWKAE